MPASGLALLKVLGLTMAPEKDETTKKKAGYEGGAAAAKSVDTATLGREPGWAGETTFGAVVEALAGSKQGP